MKSINISLHMHITSTLQVVFASESASDTNGGL